MSDDALLADDIVGPHRVHTAFVDGWYRTTVFHGTTRIAGEAYADKIEAATGHRRHVAFLGGTRSSSSV